MGDFPALYVYGQGDAGHEPYVEGFFDELRRDCQGYAEGVMPVELDCGRVYMGDELALVDFPRRLAVYQCQTLLMWVSAGYTSHHANLSLGLRS